MSEARPTAAAPSGLSLIKAIGLPEATALNINNMIGIGPFNTLPIIVSAMGGPQALLCWLVGAVVAALVLMGRIPGGWGEVVAVGTQLHKFDVFDFTFAWSRSYTFWSGVIGGAFLTTATHGTDQLMVQRYLCAKSSRQATLALLTSGAVIFAQFALFLLIGLMLYVFYQKAGPLPPEVAAKADRVFPHFIVTQLPNGIIGLVVAAIFAAAMSTLSSSLNSLAATAITDFYRPLFAPDKSDRHFLSVSRLLTALWGVVQITVAMIAIAMKGRGVDAVLAVASFTNGPVLGLFFLSALTRRVGPTGALIGVVTGIAGMILVWRQLQISWQWYVLIGSTITFATGWLASLALERTARSKAI